MNYTKVYPVEIMEGFSESGSYMLMLMEPDSQKYVPVMIGEHEAQAIILAQEQTDTRRPMTHQLMLNMMKEYMLELKLVTIDKFEEGIFHATLHMHDGIMGKKIDSRTSDAVALAIMTNCDIEMANDVLADTAIERSSLQDGYRPKEDLSETSLEELQKQLAEAEANEEYELAAELQKKIEQWTKE